MTYLLIAWLYASGALLTFKIVKNDKRTRIIDHIARTAVTATWPVWVMVGVVASVTGIARP